MIRILFFFILSLCFTVSLSGQNKGDSFSNPIDMGRYEGSISYDITLNTSDYRDNYSCTQNTAASGKDIWFKLEMDSSLYVFVHNDTDWLPVLKAHALDETGKEIRHSDWR